MIPGKLETSKIFFLVSAIVNAIGAIFWFINASAIAVATCGLGCVFYIVPVINIICCVFEFMSYARYNNLSQPGSEKLLKNTAIIEIVTVISGNLVSLVFGILNLNNLNSPEVKEYFQRSNNSTSI